MWKQISKTWCDCRKNRWYDEDKGCKCIPKPDWRSIKEILLEKETKITDLGPDGTYVAAKFSKKTKDYICNVDLVFKTAKLKNDHIRFKENNFAKLGNNERWTVVSCNDCNLGKWIKESEQNQEKYTKTQSWNKLKDYHADIHNSVQKYIDEDVEVNSKVNLKDLAIDIEILTSHIFDELNMVKKNVCLEKPEIS